MSLVEQALQKIQKGAVRTGPGQANAPTTTGRPQPSVADAGSAIVSAVSAPRAQIRLDRASLQAGGMLPDKDGERRLQAQYSQIKRPLVAAIMGDAEPQAGPLNLLMVASALPGEGKTFSSLNLALSLAREKDLSVLLVDADVAKRHLSEALGIDSRPGLVDYLRSDSEMDFSELLVGTDVERLTLLPAGGVAENASELLASNRMGELVSRLAARGRQHVVLFDSPPLMITAESRIIAGYVGQVVLVISAGETLREAAKEAIESIPENKPVSVILNKSEADVFSAYYGYGDYAQGSQ